MMLEVCGTLNISITAIWDVAVCNPADQYMFTTQLSTRSNFTCTEVLNPASKLLKINCLKICTKVFVGIQQFVLKLKTNVQDEDSSHVESHAVLTVK